MFLKRIKEDFIQKRTLHRKKGRREITMKKIISNHFIFGYSRALDLKGIKKWPNLSDDKKKDYEAIKGDWENVGKELRESTRRYREEN